MSKEIIEISKENALKAHRNGDKKEKELLENLIGKEIFNQKITDRVKTIDHALTIHGVDSNLQILLDYSGNNEILLGARTFALLQILVKVLNEGWEPNWDNSNERKWYLWFYLNKTDSDPSGFRFYDTRYGSTASAVGSRLCFKSEELALYAANKFKNLYKDFFKYQTK